MCNYNKQIVIQALTLLQLWNLEIIIPIRQEGLFSRRIDNLSTKNPSANLERQKKIIYEYLKKRSKAYNLKFDEEFWNK